MKTPAERTQERETLVIGGLPFLCACFLVFPNCEYAEGVKIFCKAKQRFSFQEIQDCEKA